MDSYRRLTSSLVMAVVLVLGIPAVASAQLESPDPLSGGSTFEGGDADAANAIDAQSPSLLPAGRTDWNDTGGLTVQTLRDPQQDNPATAGMVEGDSAFVGGDKESEPNQWSYQTHLDSPVTPGKDNLFSAWGISDLKPGANAYIYLSFFREKPTGDTYITFELNRAGANVRWVNATGTPVPCRQDGDLLISYEVNPSNDGDDVDLIVYEWTSIGATVDLDSSGSPTSDPDEVYYECGRIGDLDPLDPHPNVQAAMNFNSAIDNALPLFAVDGVPTPTSSIALGKFGEAALNLSGILGSGDGSCINFGSWQVHSRSSHSIDSQLQDRLGPGPIDVADCKIEVEKTVRRAAEPALDYGESATLHVGDTAEYRFEVTNPGNRALEVTALTDARGTEVDDEPGDVPCEPVYASGDADEDGLLAPGDEETWVYTCTYVVQESDGSGFPDTAHVVGRVPDCDGALAKCGAEDDDDASIDIIHPGITVTKDVDKGVAHVGDLLTYDIVVTNTGDTPLDVSAEDLGCTFDEEVDLEFTLAAADEESDDDTRSLSCTYEMPDGATYTNEVCVYGDDGLGDDHSVVDDCDDAETRRIVPDITVSKDVDKAVAHAGDLLTYTIVVSNTGDTPLDVSMTDVEKGTEAAGCTFTEEVPDSFELAAAGDEGGADTRTFTCTKDAPDQASYVNEVCVEGVDEIDDEHSTVGACDEVETRIIEPAIDVTKAVDKATARAGETLTYSIVVSNPSDTAIDVNMTDVEKGTIAEGCSFPAGTSMSFSLAPNESKAFTCTQAMPDQEVYVNEVCASGVDMLGGSTGTDCAEAQTTILRDPPAEPPPGQVVLGERIVPGAARLLGPTGCRGSAFRVRVAGTKVARVVFTLDGRRVSTLTKPNFRGQFALRINPRRLKVGVHRLRVVATFERGSGTRPKTMRLSFQRCARALQAPRFTG